MLRGSRMKMRRRSITMGDVRIFIGKHPCDDLPYIVGIEPDPRSDEWKERFGIDGEDYSGWYITQKENEETEEDNGEH
jgi:hypothetical protein